MEVPSSKIPAATTGMLRHRQSKRTNLPSPGT
jgi:hypothetical protein